MGIKPTLGWLALLLFTTTAQAEGARDLFKSAPPGTQGSASKLKPVPIPVSMPVVKVTPKTKAPPAAAQVSLSNVALAAKSQLRPLVVVESTAKPRGDYEAKGAVLMVFAGQKTNGLHIAKDQIHRVVRMQADERSLATIGHAASAPRTLSRDHIDVLDTEDGLILIDTRVDNAGVITNDVYTFAPLATLHQRVGSLQALPSPTQDRLREALVVAEWAPIKN